MKTNVELQKDVQNALKWEPLLSAAEIGVIAKDGIITLTGTVDNFSKKAEAEMAAKNVVGVTAVVEAIEIKFVGWGDTTDTEIASEVLNALNHNPAIPINAIKIKVEDGWVSLNGELLGNYQREAAKIAVSHLPNVKGVVNNITIVSASQNAIEKDNIQRALKRNSSLDTADIIAVNVNGNTVTLTGTVGSWHEKEEAEKTTYKVPGVWTVQNDLVVDYSFTD